MSKKKNRDDNGHKRPPKLPSIATESEDESREIFLAAVAKLDTQKPPDKDSQSQKAQNPRLAPKTDSHKSKPIQIDLHGLNLEEAKGYVRVVLQTILRDLSGQLTVTIITGKGRHSGPRGAVLPRQIHDFVLRNFSQYIVYIEESPSDVTIGGLPIRGHFRVTIRPH